MKLILFMAGRKGIEPLITVPKTAVLPLHQRPTTILIKN